MQNHKNQNPKPDLAYTPESDWKKINAMQLIIGTLRTSHIEVCEAIVKGSANEILDWIYSICSLILLNTA